MQQQQHRGSCLQRGSFRIAGMAAFSLARAVHYNVNNRYLMRTAILVLHRDLSVLTYRHNRVGMTAMPGTCKVMFCPSSGIHTVT